MSEEAVRCTLQKHSYCGKIRKLHFKLIVLSFFHKTVFGNTFWFCFFVLLFVIDEKFPNLAF